MTEILFALLIAMGIGLISGVVLSVASHFFHVKEDARVAEIRACLPGANCGACGYAGCDEYAHALVESGAKVNLCIPGADAVAEEMAAILGVAAEDVVEMVAVVQCNGTCAATSRKAEYDGVSTCRGAAMVYGGPNACNYGCLGCGDCAAVCPSDAICVQDGIARIDRRVCTGCGLCAKNCPKNIIALMPDISKIANFCSSKDKGAVAKKACTNACIGCKKCEKACPKGAISVVNNLAIVDYDKCSGCGLCVKECPTGCLQAL